IQLYEILSAIPSPDLDRLAALKHISKRTVPCSFLPDQAGASVQRDNTVAPCTLAPPAITEISQSRGTGIRKRSGSFRVFWPHRGDGPRSGKVHRYYTVFPPVLRRH